MTTSTPTVLPETQTPSAAASNKPVASVTLYPIRVSCFPKQVTRQDGKEVTIHELSISRLFYTDDKPDHRSLTINRTDAMKLLCALQDVYRQSFHAEPEEQPNDEERT